MRAAGTRLRPALAPAIQLLALLGLWELAARTGVLADVFGIEDFLVPAPSEIGEALWEDRSLLADDGWVTLKEVVLGFGLAVICGIGFAVLIHLSETARRAVYPLLVASQTIPIVILAPILVVILGFELLPKLAIIALICFFPITVNTLDGLRSVDPELIKLMRTMGAGRLETLRRVEGPWALPYAFSGAKVAVAVSVIGAVLAESAGSSAGLGHLIDQANAQLLTARSFAALVVLSAMAIGLFALLSLVERRVVTWGSER
jgi:putative hydroxymethylpyrimidine transport system permease protein